VWDPALPGEHLVVRSLGMLVPSASLAAKKLRMVPGGVEWLHGVLAERGHIDLGYELRPPANDSGSDDWYEIRCVALADSTVVQGSLMRNRTSGLVLELRDIQPLREGENVFADRFVLRLEYHDLQLVRRWNGWVEEFSAFRARHTASRLPVVASALRFVEHQRSSVEERSRQASREFTLESVWQRCSCGQEVEAGTACPHCGTSLLEAPFVKLQLRIEGRLDSELWTDAEEVVISSPGRRDLNGLEVEGLARGRLLLKCHLVSDPPETGYIRPSPNTAVYDEQRQACLQLKAGSPRTGLLALNIVRPGLVTGASPGEHDLGDTRLNAEQRDVVARVAAMRPGQALLVQGPPGTGKTTAIVDAIRAVLARRPDVRILFASHSNEAVDSGQERLLPVPGVRQVRVAAPGKVAPRLHHTLADGPKLDDYNLVAGTVNRLVIDERVRSTRFDYVILDEANKVLIAEALALLPLGTRWILVGDPNQLPPILDDGAQRFEIETPEDALQVQDSFYAWHWRQAPEGMRAFLPRQYRMAEPIGDLVSDVFYSGELINEVPPTEVVLPGPLDTALVWIDTGQRAEHRGARMSLSNEFEVALCRELAASAREREPRARLAVIAMYADQVKRLQHELAELVDSHDIESVDAFEGREADLVVLSLVRSNQRGSTGFIEDPRRVNVAISRARRQLVIVGDSTTVARTEGGLFQRIFDRCRERGSVVEAAALLEAGRPLRML
jgi:hypothetical protein